MTAPLNKTQTDLILVHAGRTVHAERLEAVALVEHHRLERELP